MKTCLNTKKNIKTQHLSKSQSCTNMLHTIFPRVLLVIARMTDCKTNVAFTFTLPTFYYISLILLTRIPFYLLFVINTYISIGPRVWTNTQDFSSNVSDKIELRKLNWIWYFESGRLTKFRKEDERKILLLKLQQ